MSEFNTWLDENIKFSDSKSDCALKAWDHWEIKYKELEALYTQQGLNMFEMHNKVDNSLCHLELLRDHAIIHKEHGNEHTARRGIENLIDHAEKAIAALKDS